MSNTALSSIENEPAPIATKEGNYKVSSTTLVFATGERWS